ncbi:hypothetical protein K402DRAFT_44485 [Aulographum hederae CBS 113979]|uniref:Uncharacterized protein n=1 Tax=Aulographum hederae CBS 113979 TaxID=1176131 RepID=A0A6G1H3K4_9PEZI|nr:hypothetical protein K402DRAFT_44485 [Aulographum hederae CBS 113979]
MHRLSSHKGNSATQTPPACLAPFRRLSTHTHRRHRPTPCTLARLGKANEPLPRYTLFLPLASPGFTDALVPGNPIQYHAVLSFLSFILCIQSAYTGPHAYLRCCVPVMASTTTSPILISFFYFWGESRDGVLAFSLVPVVV